MAARAVCRSHPKLVELEKVGEIVKSTIFIANVSW